MLFSNNRLFLAGAVYMALAVSVATPSQAADENKPTGRYFWSGDWSLTVGGDFFRSPKFNGSNEYRLSGKPLISIGSTGAAERFSSRNDNISVAIVDTQDFRAGVNGKFLLTRKVDWEDGQKRVPWGGELGGFMEFYPTNWFRLRAEARHGVRAHKGMVADISGDAFYDVTPDIRISGGPRLSFASRKYFDTYYGINDEESAASGLSAYSPSGSGIASVGVGGAVTWKATDKITTSVYAEYTNLQGKAAQSSIVTERGSRNQLTVGALATYRFDFTLD